MNLLKKTLLATAVAAISTGSMAAALTATATKISTEGFQTQSVANDGSVYTMASDVVVTSSVNWSKDDTVTFTLDGATFAADQTFTLVDSGANTNPGAGGPEVFATFTLMGTTENTVTFRVAQVQTSGVTEGGTFKLVAAGNNADGIILPAGASLEDEVSLTAVVASSAGQVIDSTDTDTVKTAELIQQYTWAPTVVTNQLAQFGDGSDAQRFKTLDSDLVLSTALTDNGGQGPFAYDVVETTVKGPLAAFITTENAENGSASIDAGTQTAATATSVTFTESGAANLATVVTLAETAGNSELADEIAAGKFTVSYKLENVAGKEVVIPGNELAGKIGLDTLSAVVPYLPVGDAVSPFVWVTNHSNSEFGIHAVATTVNGATYDLGVLATSKPGLKKIDAPLVQALKDAGVNTEYETINLQLFIDGAAGADEISVYAAYKHVGDSDRLQVPVRLNAELQQVD